MNAAGAGAAPMLPRILSAMRNVIGDDAAYALLRYAGETAAREAPAGAPDEAVRAAARTLAEIVGAEVEVLEDRDDHTLFRIHDPALLSDEQRPVQGLLVGFLEGALARIRHRAFEGVVVASQNGSLTTLIDLRPRRSPGGTNP